MPKSESNDYLHKCLALHGQLTELYYTRRQDLMSVEGAANRIRSSRKLEYEDLEVIINPNLWDGSEFWRWPSRTEIEAALEEESWDFWNLPRNERRILDQLVRLFRFIEPVSVILRFIVPKEYGILSPPVTKVLEVRRGSSLVETYLNYVSDLRELRDQRKFDSAAEVDMALWVLQKGVLDGILPDQTELAQAFKNDIHLRRIRVRNLTLALFSELTRIQLAEALIPVDLTIAAQIAGIEFERMVKEQADATEDKDLCAVIDQMYRRDLIDSVTRGYWHRARQTRNLAIHGESRLDRRSVEDLISEIKTPRHSKTPKRWQS